MAGGYETRDVVLRPVLTIGASIVLLALFSAGAMAWLLHTLEARQARESPPASPLAGIYGPTEPPSPRLQVHPLDDLRQLRMREDAQLGTYGWVDRAHGVVRLPVERAMALLAERSRRGSAK